MAAKTKILLHVPAGFGALALAIPGAAAAAEPAGTPQVEEILVTSQKRSQNLQEVPLAVSAIGAVKLEQLNVRDVRDISGIAPNVTAVQSTTSNSAAVISMRGISSPAGEGFGLDSANAVYVDGVYIARSAAAATDVMDLARVEVLRGPQGTLFGRNSTGGAIAFVSRDPSDKFGATASVGAGNFNSRNAKILVDTGAVGILKSTLSYSHSQRDGFVDNLLEPSSDKDPGAREADAFRAAFVLDFSPKTRLRYIYDWSKVTGTNYAFQLTNVADGTPLAPLVVNGQPAIPLTQQAPVRQYLAAATFLQPQCAALAAPTRAYRDTICLNSDDLAIDESQGHNLQFETEFGPVKFKSTTGFRKWDSITRGSDLDGLGGIRGPLFSQATLFNGMPASLLAFIPTIPAAARGFIASSPVPTTTQDLFTTSNVRDHEQISQEFEFSGKTDNLDWVAGAFYFHEYGGEVNPQNSGFVLDTNSIFLGNFGPLGPSFTAANPARYRLVVTNGVLQYRVSSVSKAFYGQGTWYVGGRDGKLSLTAGIRSTDDSKHITRAQNGAVRPAVSDTGDASFQKTTWSLMSRYAFTDDVSGYLRVATGYRSGGFNSQDTPLAGTTRMVAFQPESLTSYEAGIKTQMFDRRLRLNAAAYWNDYKDFAVNIPVATATTGVFGSRIVNAGEVRYTGFEIEGEAILSSILSVDGSIGVVDPSVEELLIPTSGAPGAPVVNVASISKSGYTSKNTANFGVNAVMPVGAGDMKLRGRIGYTYESPKYSFANILGAPFNEQLKGDARSLIDAQLALESIPVGGGMAELRVWGKNLTDEHDFARGIDFGALGFAGGYYADPRTFGVALTVKY